MHWQLLVLLLLPVCVAVWRQLHCCWRSSLPTAPGATPFLLLLLHQLLQILWAEKQIAAGNC
jgi:hypothetical protein